MGSLDDMMAEDDAFLLSEDGPFTEADAVYYVKRDGTRRRIYPEINRHPAAIPEEFTEGKVDVFTLAVVNSSAGISQTELDHGGDRVEVAPRRGGTAKTYLLPEPWSQDAGRLVFRIGSR